MSLALTLLEDPQVQLVHSERRVDPYQLLLLPDWVLPNDPVMRRERYLNRCVQTNALTHLYDGGALCGYRLRDDQLLYACGLYALP